MAHSSAPRISGRTSVSSGPAERTEDLEDQWPIRLPLSAFTLDGFSDWATSSKRPWPSKLSFLGDLIFMERPGHWAIQIPLNARTLEGFCEWATSRHFPHRGRISFLGQEIVITMSPEELETHNKAKMEVCRVIGNLNHEEDLGSFYGDRTLLRNKDGDLSTEPDGSFASWKSLETGRVFLKPRKDKEGQFIEIQGTPDWVLEVVSDDTVGKDTRTLRQKYHRAGIPEYWLIDARRAKISFQILLRGRTGYRAAPAKGGWQTSRVFGRRFRLERRRDRLGLWQYTLQVETP
ncbi:MAG: Uma2 family endonuclease [Planctomycetes bacterium]|nr:Uma2 family endonuclease [Planctomycetota bacterium]